MGLPIIFISFHRNSFTADWAIISRGNGPLDVFVTRLHVRYDAAHFPEDLIFQETGDRQNFQSRYVLRHPWKGSDKCAETVSYREG